MLTQLQSVWTYTISTEKYRRYINFCTIFFLINKALKIARLFSPFFCVVKFSHFIELIHILTVLDTQFIAGVMELYE